jgi:hypothetical protein
MNKTEEFIADMEQRKKESISAYKTGGHESMTAGDVKKTTYHADQNMTPEQKKRIRSVL